jgi:spore maturation protein CgeB
MRILQLIESSAHSAFECQTWIRNLHEPLLDLGCGVDLISTTPARVAWRNGDKRALADFNDRVLAHFRRQHARAPFDLLFAYVVDGMLDPAMIAEIRRAGVVAVNFSCNNCHQFHLVREISRHFDYNLHAEGDTGRHFIESGARPLWWPMASNPKYFRPYDVPREVPVSFIGANYALRARYIAYLLEHGIDVQVFGPTWRYAARTPFRARAKRAILLAQSALARTPEARATASALLAGHDFNLKLDAGFRANLHGAIWDDELVRYYSRCHITLGFVEVHDRNDPSREIRRHLHLREFEAPMSGALYCTGHIDELERFFEPGREIVTYRNEEDLLAQVRRLLDHPQDAERIRRAGMRRALAEHTYHHRFETLFRAIGLKAQCLQAAAHYSFAAGQTILKP